MRSLACPLCLLVTLCAAPASAHDPAILQDMVEQALSLQKLVESGPGLFRQRISYPLADSSRHDLDFVPNEMKESRGATIGIMPLSSRRAGHALLQTALSQEGYLLATSIMSLEEVLRGMELWSQARLTGDYAFQIFGTPSTEEAWGWKVEGHHLSVNVTMEQGELRATPLFVGANPAEIRNGPRGGLRIMAPHQDLAFALVSSLTAEQLTLAHDPTSPTAGILQRHEQTLEPGEVGVSASVLTDSQRHLLMSLVETYMRSLQPSMASEEMARLESAGTEKLRFQWQGDLDPSHRHYYTIQGPTLVIEFDRVGEREDANHIHAVLRDPARDFGVDLLGEHYRENH
jgi:hypothetical protein